MMNDDDDDDFDSFVCGNNLLISEMDQMSSVFTNCNVACTVIRIECPE